MAFWRTIRMSTAAALTITSATRPGSTDDFPIRRNTKTKRLLSSAPTILLVRDRETPITAGMSLLGVSQVFTPTFTMSINLGGMKWVEGNDVQSNGFKASSLGLPGFIDTYSPQFPIVSLTNYLPQGPVAGAGQGAFPRSAASGSIDFVKVRRAAPILLRIYGGGNGRKRRALSFHAV